MLIAREEKKVLVRSTDWSSLGQGAALLALPSMANADANPAGLVGALLVYSRSFLSQRSF